MTTTTGTTATGLGAQAATAPLVEPLPLSFAAADVASATEPPEHRGTPRDHVRLLVSPGQGTPRHSRFDALPTFLAPGDLVVVNTSATVPAAADATLPDGTGIVAHLATALPGGLWLVEPRRPLDGGSTAPADLGPSPTRLALTDGTTIDLLRLAAGSRRLWLAAADTDLLAAFSRVGRPIRYRYVPQDWPLDAYQTVFATEPGSAEMPSAARPFTAAVVTDLVRRGVGVVPLTLHTGVSSLEGGELPYPERFRVPPATAEAVNATRAAGGRVVAVGTTVVRALESAAGPDAAVHPADGWTDLVITPGRGVRVVDAMVTGWHEPAATHLAMLEAVAGRVALVAAYEAAHAAGYRWHEFGDSHLILPAYPGRS